MKTPITTTWYVPCGCRDCMELAIGEPAALCWACKEAGCEANAGECCVPPDLDEEAE